MLLLLALAGAGACAPRAGQAEASASPPLEPARAEQVGGAARLLELPVDGFLPALLFVPAGIGAARLVIATHGAGGEPEWTCDHWRRLTQERAFVLCLRGKSMGAGGGYYYPDHHALDAELVAAERAARATEPRIKPGDGIYAGYSQGASMGSIIAARHARAFPYLVLVEGFERWNIPRLRAFARGGGKRILFACGTGDCRGAAEEAVRYSSQAGVEARVEYASGAGHTAGGDVMARVQGALPWLLAE